MRCEIANAKTAGLIDRQSVNQTAALLLFLIASVCSWGNISEAQSILIPELMSYVIPNPALVYVQRLLVGCDFSDGTVARSPDTCEAHLCIQTSVSLRAL